MSDCGCTGYYHSTACSDVNVVYWMDTDGKLPKAGIPVNPTAEENRDTGCHRQKTIGYPDKGVRFLTMVILCRDFLCGGIHWDASFRQLAVSIHPIDDIHVGAAVLW